MIELVVTGSLAIIALVILGVGAYGLWLLAAKVRERERSLRHLLEWHFQPTPLEELITLQRTFPSRCKADLQRTLDRVLDADEHRLVTFHGIAVDYAPEGIDFANLTGEFSHYTARIANPQYEEVLIGEDEPVRCLTNGLWLLRSGRTKWLLLLTAHMRHMEVAGMRVEIVLPGSASREELSNRIFDALEKGVADAGSYRGKVLSLEADGSFRGSATGVTVHRLPPVGRDDVILQPQVLDLIDRNVLRFAADHARLAGMGQSRRKGLLFYGPPGNGKTHTINYLASTMKDHTFLLITGSQVALLDEYLTLARLLQPAVVVIEDVDLIARRRQDMHGPAEESMLNHLLNEMDGLREDARLIFLLTTNQPDAIEPALAGRPGRIDQAVEFPLPDEGCRRRLIRLYGAGMHLGDEVVDEAVTRTAHASAAFIKELLRKTAQIAIERDDRRPPNAMDLRTALEEITIVGGSLNKKLLGFEG